MTDTTETTTTGDVDIDVNISDVMNYSHDYDEANIYVKRPDVPPLSVQETHATVKITTDAEMIEVKLDAEELDALVDGLVHAQEYHFNNE